MEALASEHKEYQARKPFDINVSISNISLLAQAIVLVIEIQLGTPGIRLNENADAVIFPWTAASLPRVVATQSEGR